MTMTKKTVLIVEDSQTQRILLECMLAENGLDVLCAGNGKEALHKAQMYLPEIIILDVELPDINGLQLYKLFKENKHTRFIPIILFTSMSYAEIARSGFQANDARYISKDKDAEKTLLSVLYTKGFIDDIYTENLLGSVYADSMASFSPYS